MNLKERMNLEDAKFAKLRTERSSSGSMKMRIVGTAALAGMCLAVCAVQLGAQQPGGGTAEVRARLVWVDRQGNADTLAAPPRAYGLPRLSPDGRSVAIEIRAATSDIWVYEIASGSLTQVTTDGASRFPLWSLDGKRIAFGSGKAGPVNVYWKNSDGTGEEERLASSENPLGPQSFSPDGRLLSFYEIHPETGRDIWMLPLAGDRKPWLFLKTKSLEGGAVFSPDGQWLAYVSDDTGRFEIYVQPFPGPGERQRVSVEGGAEPMWARDGRELFFREGNKVFAAGIVTQPALAIGKPALLFEGRYDRSPGSRANYDVAPDGRLLMVQAER